MKSYVSMENKVCPICGITHDHDCGILLDKRIRDNLEQTTVTGFGLCAEHAAKFEEGYVCMVAVSNTQGTMLKPEDAIRTGEVAHIKFEVFPHIFGHEADRSFPLLYCDPGVIEHLKQRMEPTGNEH